MYNTGWKHPNFAHMLQDSNNWWLSQLIYSFLCFRSRLKKILYNWWLYHIRCIPKLLNLFFTDSIKHWWKTPIFACAFGSLRCGISFRGNLKVNASVTSLTEHFLKSVNTCMSLAFIIFTSEFAKFRKMKREKLKCVK